MSSNKKFKIQNGVDITGDVVVGGQLVIQSDGTIVLPSSMSTFISQAVESEIADLQSQVDEILGSSPEHLDTLQEIVTLFQSADGDLATLINQNSTSIAALQSSIDTKAVTSDVTTLSTSVDEVQTLMSGSSPSATLSTTSTNVVDAINEIHSNVDSLSGVSHINYDASTGEISIDETSVAANLHVATAGDTNTLNGKDSSHYRQDVYDIHGNIIN